jgi:hypothetical protein
MTYFMSNINGCLIVITPEAKHRARLVLLLLYYIFPKRTFLATVAYLFSGFDSRRYQIF